MESKLHAMHTNFLDIFINSSTEKIHHYHCSKYVKSIQEIIWIEAIPANYGISLFPYLVLTIVPKNIKYAFYVWINYCSLWHI